MSSARESQLAKLMGKRVSRRTALRTGTGAVAATALAVTTVTPAAAEESAGAASGSWKPPYFQTTPQGGASDFASALAQLDGIVADIQSRTGVPGIAVSVVYQDQVVYAKGFGVREIGTDTPVDADTIFQLASMSKPVGSTVVAHAVSAGHVTWNARISDLMPWFEMFDSWVSREVTVADLYSHRSGLPDHSGDLLEDLGYDRLEVLRRLRYQRPDYGFRNGYSYTNFGLTAAAEAVAEYVGNTWEDLSAQLLYEPLGMTRTSSRFSDYINAENRAHGHWEVTGSWTVCPVREPDPESPAGGVSSTVHDMAQWVRLQLAGGAYNGESLIGADALAETHRPQIRRNFGPGTPESDRNSFYGLGWNVGYDDEGRTRLGHSGGFRLGAGTCVYMVPADQFGIVVLTNGWAIGAAESIALMFQDLVLYGEIRNDYLPILEEVFRGVLAPKYQSDVDLYTPPADATPPRPAAAYVGLYLNDLYGPVEVLEQDGELWLRLRDGLDPFPLWHYDRDVFAFDPIGENAGAPSAVVFTVNEDGLAAEVTIAYFNEFEQGTFWRPQEAEGGE